MAADSDTLLHYIRRLAARTDSDKDTDAALLGRFISERDDRAFAALVHRHGPLVLQVCRRVLGDADDADDAFQAVFLVLARKASAVRPRKALPAWLHGVARRVALKARSTRLRRLRAARPLAAPAADGRPDPLAELSARELLAILDEEVQRLPERYRLPVILCCLEGRTLEEAARQLSWTPGSLKGRLERGRARLHDRLVRRGLTLAAALAAAEVSRSAASAATVAGLAAATVQSAILFAMRSTAASGVSPGAAALAGETLTSMALGKLKLAVTLMLATCLVTTGYLTYRAAQAVPTAALQERSVPLSSKNPVAQAAPTFVKNQAKLLDEVDAPIEVSGRVFDPSGKPFDGAKLYVGYSVRRDMPDRQFRQTTYRLRATSSANGQFHFSFRQSELDAQALDDSRPTVIAMASGYGPAWAEIPSAAGSPDRDTGEAAEFTLKLVEDLPVNGRILGPNRQPVTGAKVHLLDVLSTSEEGVTRYLRGDVNSWYPSRWRGPLPGQPLGITTDAEGRFQLSGLGRDRIVRLALEGQAIPHTSITAITRPMKATPWVNGAAFDYVASASRSLRGVVRDKATGRPVAGVKMSAQNTTFTALTDSDGRFEILGCPKVHPVYFVRAQPQTDQPYFAAVASVPERAGPDPLTVDFDLVRGIPLSGRVADQSTQKPPRAAVVEYYPLFPNRHSVKISIWCNMPASSAVIRPDGSFSLAVLPGPGVVCVTASPRDSCAVALVDDNEVRNLFQDGKNHSGGQRLATDTGANGTGILWVHNYNALYLINPEETAELPVINLSVQAARTVQGTVAAPDGKPLTGVQVTGLTALPNDQEMLEGASFTVTGLNPLRSRELIFYHREKALGKILTVRGDEAQPLTVQLEPCGWVIGRMVSREGKPVPRLRLHFFIDAAVETHGDGRFRAALVPGQKYGLALTYPHSLLKNIGVLEVDSGQTKDLGDLTLAN